MRLVKNARAAMPKGGTLLLATDEVDLPGADPRARLPAGRCARLRVRDTGTGIEARYLDQVFEPFFTLGPGGTGLGLSMVQGVVRQFHGDIHVSSTLGEGTELAIYLNFAPS
jgi:signal transduction histidine kinase